MDTKKVYDTDGLALYFRVYLSDVEYVVDTDSSSSKKVSGKRS